jgi:hypothetical protein
MHHSNAPGCIGLIVNDLMGTGILKFVGMLRNWFVLTCDSDQSFVFSWLRLRRDTVDLILYATFICRFTSIVLVFTLLQRKWKALKWNWVYGTVSVSSHDYLHPKSKPQLLHNIIMVIFCDLGSFCHIIDKLSSEEVCLYSSSGSYNAQIYRFRQLVLAPLRKDKCWFVIGRMDIIIWFVIMIISHII